MRRLCASVAAIQGLDEKNFPRYFINLYQLLRSSIYAYLFICVLWLFRNVFAGAAALPPIIIYSNFPIAIKIAGAFLLPWLLRQPTPAVTTEAIAR